jgi:hypothetical protein
VAIVNAQQPYAPGVSASHPIEAQLVPYHPPGVITLNGQAYVPLGATPPQYQQPTSYVPGLPYFRLTGAGGAAIIAAIVLFSFVAFIVVTWVIAHIVAIAITLGVLIISTIALLHALARARHGWSR